MPPTPRILSGMQPTGALPVGNHFGALRRWATMAAAGTPEAVFCLVDTAEDCRSGALGRGECKRVLIEQLNAELTPLRQRAQALRQAPGNVLSVLEAGRAKAGEIARQTVAEVRDAMGTATSRKVPP